MQGTEFSFWGSEHLSLIVLAILILDLQVFLSLGLGSYHACATMHVWNNRATIMRDSGGPC